MRPYVIETADEDDLAELWRLESGSFEPGRRSSRRSLRRSLASPHQLVRILRSSSRTRTMAASILMKHRRAWRLYSVAVAPEARGHGFGKALISDAIVQATAAGAEWLHLEVAALDAALVSWYESQDFMAVRRLSDYYGPGRPALRMRRRLVRLADRPAPGAAGREQ